MKKTYLVLLFLSLFINQSFGQGATCATAAPFCAGGSSLTFPNNTNVPNLGAVHCLSTTPNPAWFYMQVANGGPLIFNLSQNSNATGGGIDVDFAVWGPFPNPTCAPSLTAANLVDCSYSASAVEQVDIPNALPGQFYMVLITNFSNQPGQITLNQTNGSSTGAGSTNCDIVCPLTLGIDVQTCVNSPNIITATIAGATSYVWSSNQPGFSAGNTQSITVSSSIPGTYTYTVVVNKPGCVANSTDTMTVTYDVPTIGTANNLTRCLSQPTFDLTVNTPPVVNGSGNYIGYHTSLADAQNGTAGATIINPTNYPGTNGQTIYVSLEDATTGCVATTSFTLTISPEITNPSPQQNLCVNGDPTPFSVQTSFAGTDAISYVYFTSQQTGNNMYTGGTLLSNVTPIATIATYDAPALGNAGSLPNVAGTYYVYAIANPTPGPNGTCPIAQEIIVVVNNITTPTFTQVADICTGAFLAPLPLISLENIVGVWSPPIDNTTTTTYNFTPAPGQCALPTSMTIVVNPLPTATISGTISVCQGSACQNVTFTGAGGTAPYTFTYNDGSSNQTITSTAGNTATICVPTTTPGVFTYTLLSVQDSSSTTCSQNQTGTATITVNELPTATISGTSDFCEGTGTPQITFTAPTGTAPFTFTYNVNGSATTQTVTTTTTGNTYVLNVPNTPSGTFNYNLLSVADANGCSQAQTGTATITINPLPTATISGTTGVCLNDPSPNITFTGIVGTAPFTFTYEINNVVQPTVTTTTGNSITVAVPTSPAGTYTYTLLSVQDSSSTACSQNQTGTATVTVGSAPTIVNPTPFVICDDNNDGQGCFDLHTKDNEITAGNTGLQVLYYETLAGSQLGGTLNLITANPYCTINNLGFQTVYVRVFDPAAPLCASFTTLDLITNPRPLPNPTITEYALCDYNNPGDGVEVFDLTTKDVEIANGQTGVAITYYETQGAATAQTPPIATPTAYQNTSNPQTIWFTIENTTTGCFSVGSFTIRVNPLPTVFPTQPNNQCSNGASNQAIFNLSVNNPIVTGGIPGIIVTYYNTLADAQAPQSPISSTSYLGTDGEIVYIRLQNSATGCYSTSQVQLFVTQGPVANTPTPLQYCDPNNDGFGVFNLEDATFEIAGNPVPTGVSVSYYETMTDAQIGASPSLTSPYANIQPNTQTIYVRVFYTLTGCANIVQLQLIVNPTPEATEPDDYHVCDDNYDGIGTFDLTTQDALVLGSIDPTTHTVYYYETLALAQAGDPTTAISNVTTFQNTVVNTQTIYVRVETTATGCFDIVELQLVVDPKPNALQPNYPQYSLCETPTAGIGYEIFDLASQIPSILLGQTGMNVTFHFSQADADAGTPSLPLQYQNQAIYVQTLWIRIENAATHCYVISTMDIRVNPLPTPIPPTTPFVVCDTDQDGFSQFDLSTLIADMQQGANYDITFYHTEPDAQGGQVVNQLTLIYNNIDDFIEFIWVRAEDPVTGCYTVFQIELNVNPRPIMPTTLDPLVQCDTDNNNQNGFSSFNLEVQTPIILAAQTGPASDYTVTYYISQADAEASPNGLNPIINTTNYINTSNPQTICARVQNNATGCFQTSCFPLQVNLPLALTTPTPLRVCDNDANPNDLHTTFDLTVKDAEITQNLAGYTVTYYPAPVNAGNVAGATPINPATAYINVPNAVQTLGVEVTSPNGCKSYTTLTIRVLPVPVPRFDPPALAPQCDYNNPGDMLEIFNLTVNAAYIMNNNPDVTLHYYPSYTDATNSPPTNEIGNPSAALVGQNVWIRVESNLYTGSDGENCYALVEQPLRVDPLPSLATIADYQICEEDPIANDGFEIFDLTSQEAALLANNPVTTPPSTYTLTYYTDAALANQIQDPTMFTNTTNPQTIYVVAVNDATGCRSQVGQFNILVNPKPDFTAPTTLLNTCDSDGTNDGYFAYPLDGAVTTEILNGQDPLDYTVTFYDSEYNPDATPPLTPTPIADLANYMGYTHTIWAAVTNNVTGCQKIGSFAAIVEQLPTPVITTVNGVTSICVDFTTNVVVRTLTLTADNTTVYLDPTTTPAFEYQWFEDGVQVAVTTTPSYTITQPLNDTVSSVFTVQMINQTTLMCSQTSPDFTVLQSGQATPVTPPGYTVTNAFSDNQIITVDVQGYGNYLYSIDNGPQQTSPIFENVSLGTHTITVWDNEGSCDPLILEEVQTIDYPHYFTPNGDGINDTWNINGLQGQAGAKIFIFDRYGKLLKQISSTGLGWDGTYNGTELPSTDYWFTVDFMEQSPKQFKAHFTLKR